MAKGLSALVMKELQEKKEKTKEKETSKKLCSCMDAMAIVG
jgi:hypothetical protein